jgi:hypothetical protein
LDEIKVFTYLVKAKNEQKSHIFKGSK